MLIITMTAGVGEREVAAIPGVYAVESEEDICFMALPGIPAFPAGNTTNWLSLGLFALPLPSEAAAALLQLLPPEV